MIAAIKRLVTRNGNEQVSDEEDTREFTVHLSGELEQDIWTEKHKIEYINGEVEFSTMDAFVDHGSVIAVKEANPEISNGLDGVPVLVSNVQEKRFLVKQNIKSDEVVDTGNRTVTESVDELRTVPAEKMADFVHSALESGLDVEVTEFNKTDE